jgi:NAD-dependent SIR2 family protein deacetylase
MDEELGTKIEIAATWIVKSRRPVFFTGAGISTESGLPDFRGPDGVWTRRDKGLPPSQVDWSSIKPNRAHKALVELQNIGKLDFLISQNVDNLHLASGILPQKIAELHGNKTLMRCLDCTHVFKKEEVGWVDSIHGPGYRTLPAKRNQPICPDCGGRLISSVVNFGDPMPEREMRVAIQHSRFCDLFFIIGSSLVVYPAADMPIHALKSGAKLIMINQGKTPFDEYVHVRFLGKAGEIMPAIVERVKHMMDLQH